MLRNMFSQSNIRVQLDSSNYFTNLDFVSGKLVLTLTSEEDISAITVKLEGESRTRLVGIAGRAQHNAYNYDTYQDRREKTEMEIHKLLYKVITLFPSSAQTPAITRNATYTIPPGQHEYPFRFKLPINNDCQSYRGSPFPNLHVSGLRVEVARDSNRHIKSTLPPSLSGFPGKAQIRYWVKGTVQRPAFYKENFRAEVDFRLIPIDPPRHPGNMQEVYARRQHQFSSRPSTPTRQGLFRKPTGLSEVSTNKPRISVDGRLPDPPILTSDQPLPLRLLVKRLNETSEVFYLRSLHIEIVGHTLIRAHELQTAEFVSWVVLTKANINVALRDAEVGREVEVDATMWRDLRLPHTICPTFDTCNIRRYYTLEIKVGLAVGSSDTIGSEVTVQSLSMPCKVYSGIAPPPALLAAATNASRPTSNTNASLQNPNQMPSPAFSHAPSGSPVGQPESSSSIPDYAPPSYEDAIAEDYLAPADRPFPGYQPPTSAGQSRDQTLFPDPKG